jgi:adenylate cyclase class IV
VAELSGRQEVELKLGFVDPGALSQLLGTLPPPSSVTQQHNHYLVDVAGRLPAAQTMVRVREERDWGAEQPRRVVLTIKRRQAIEQGVFVADELEQELPREIWSTFKRDDAREEASKVFLRQPGPAMAWLRDFLAGGVLRIQGAMVNIRRAVEVDGFTLEVDETHFPGDRVDVEVEVETSDPEGARRVVERVAAAAGVALFEQALGKYARFLQIVVGRSL